MGRVVLTGAVALTVVGAAWAQTPDTTVKAVATRDPHRAMWTSLAVTAIPIAVGAVLATGSSGQGGGIAFMGIWFGPAVGYWTNGIASRSVPGLLIRTGGALIVAVGQIAPVAFPAETTTHSSDGGANALVWCGTVLVLGSAIYDIATVDRKVREHEKTLSSLTIAPLFSAKGRSAGLQVAFRF